MCQVPNSPQAPASCVGLDPNVIGNDKVTSAKVTLKPHAYAYAAVPLGTDDVLVIMKTGSSGSGDLAVQTWTPNSTWSDLTNLGLSTNASPAAAARTPENYTVVAQSGSALKYMHGNAEGPSLVWQDVPGGIDWETGATYAITNASGTPAVVSPSPYQLALFYRTSDGLIKFSEWNSGYGWRTTPLSLGKPTATAVSVDPVAVARDENHIAVFVVVDSKLYVKEWSNANASDWSDTTWTAWRSNSATRSLAGIPKTPGVRMASRGRPSATARS